MKEWVGTRKSLRPVIAERSEAERESGERYIITPLLGINDDLSRASHLVRGVSE